MPREKLQEVIRDILDFPKAGIVFKDITPALKDPVLCDEIAQFLFLAFAGKKIDAVVGVESRGFLFGMLLAQKFKVPFIPIRKAGRLPHTTVAYSYDLEYGSASVEMHEDALEPGSSVLIHDDLLATGGTAVAAAELVKMVGGKVAGFAFIVELEFLNGRDELKKYSAEIKSIIQY
jgi:adenine phosphoribosyltransferase